MSSPEHFEQGLISIATALNLPYKEHSKVSVRQFVYDWLQYSAKDGWMITLDDFEDTNILDYMTDAQSSPREIVSKATPTIRDLFPQHPKGSILLTSRRKNLAMELTENYKSVIEVGAMSAEEGVQLLRENYSDICNDDDSARLTSFFGYLPLAIVAAARYLNQRHQNIGMYLIKIEQEMSELHSEILILGRQNPLDKMYGQILGNLKSRSRGLFFLVSLCSCEAIPEYLLRAFFTHLQLDSAVSGDPNVAFEEDITSLTSNYCIQISDSRDFFSIHRMTQAWVRRYLDSDGSLDRWVRVYSEILPSLFRKFDPRDERRSQLVPHAAAAVDYSLEFGWDLRQISILAIEVADCAEAQKNDRLAQELRLKAEKSKSETFHL
ncbi:MAG: hypothetical protein LQ342_004071 [Letrouitia transgressa]|nr:MAG: hypothetical protein LQ342_004071 [Letrouitia transgressa]